MVTVVSRIEVRGGFLDDLDLELRPGLNVLIGPRGSGKTSLLEIMRFAFGVPGLTPAADEQAREHALAVLADGAVTVTLERDGREGRLMREANDASATGPAEGAMPLIVSQSEVEEIGLNARSRLQILDGLVNEHWDPAAERAVLEDITRATERLGAVVEDLDQQRSRLLELAKVPEALRTAEAHAAEQSETSKQMAVAQGELQQLSEQAEKAQRAERRAADAAHKAAQFAELVDEAREAGQALAGARLPTEFDDRAKGAVRTLKSVVAEAAEIAQAAQAAFAAAADAVVELGRTLRDHGSTLEVLQEGAGELARELTRLREYEAERAGVQQRVAALETELQNLQASRSGLLDNLDALRDRRFELRKAAAARVAEMFNGEIEVQLAKGGLYREYEFALSSALEGSNLQYKALARQLVQRLSPRELVESVERGDVAFIATTGQITEDRAQRLVAYLRSRGCGGILTVALEDMTDFALLDGTVHKTTAQLSTGQRCTVVLPLLLAQSSRLTILDQPEDHLDNAFVVDTLVQAVVSRKGDAQALIATHNPNIPVLGEADRVIVMESDGKHGGVRHAGSLDDAKVVEAITSVMEGGAEAFERRVEFYGRHRA